MATNPTYECTLSDESVKKAREELNEEPSERQSQLKQFSDWIDQEKKWLTTTTDPVFLLCFLRTRKFSQLLARETLVNYLISREKESQYFKKFDVDDPNIQAALKLGFYLPLPKRDIHGRQVVLIRAGRMDISGNIKVADMFRTVFMILDYLMMDEHVQVNGVTVIVDYTGINRNYLTFFGDSTQTFLKLLTATYPVRFKNIFIYNVGAFMDLIVGIIKAALREKLQQRVETFSDMVGIYEKVGQSTLPLDYLPDHYKGESPGTCDNIADNLITELEKPKMRKWIRMLSSGKFKVDEMRMPPREELFQEAYRTKLNVD